VIAGGWMGMEYKLSKQRGALNEVEPGHGTPMPAQNRIMQQSVADYAQAHSTAVGAFEAERVEAPRRKAPLRTLSRGWFTTIDQGEQVLVTDRSGHSEIVAGPKRLWSWGRRFRLLQRHVAHPGEFLIVRRKDGGQVHLPGPVDLWEDPREHASIETEEELRLDAKEAVVVYARSKTGQVSRRLVHGPAAFVPEPGEWLHSFSWHGSRWSNGRYLKVPNALVFQKLWLMPDQMYHDVPDVRTADDALLMVRLMIFFELVDIERMLESTHDPIGDFVNAATSDVIDWVGRYDFESFKRNTEKLNDLETYRQLVGRAEQCGYRIHKVVYRGYGATEALQRMHDEAIESRTRLQLERATEHQAQELEDVKLEREHTRAARRRTEEAAKVTHEIELARRKQEAELQDAEIRLAFQRAERDKDEKQRLATEAARDTGRRTHLEGMGKLGVDLTAWLTSGQADQVVELRTHGGAIPHVHVRHQENGAG
jgi:hypothetical protein